MVFLPYRCNFFSLSVYIVRLYVDLVHLISMAGFSDIQLPDTVAQGVLRGDRSALAEAYRVLAAAVMNLASRILQDRQLAEEVVQDTFIDLVEKSGQISSAEAIAAWVRKVAVNHCLMRLRSPWHAKRSEADAEDIFATQGDHSMEWVAVVPTLERALGALTAEARSVVWLHDVEGYTHKEIGQLMGKTASFSKSQLARAYEKLLAWQAQRDTEDAAHTSARRTTNLEGQNDTTTLGNIGSPCAS
jgi:RNA polymerase sigma factor (sigma-70 family)